MKKIYKMSTTWKAASTNFKYHQKIETFFPTVSAAVVTILSSKLNFIYQHFMAENIKGSAKLNFRFHFYLYPIKIQCFFFSTPKSFGTVVHKLKAIKISESLFWLKKAAFLAQYWYQMEIATGWQGRSLKAVMTLWPRLKT